MNFLYCFTVFARTNMAFDKLPAEDIDNFSFVS